MTPIGNSVTMNSKPTNDEPTNDKPIVLVAIFHAKPETREELLGRLVELAKLTVLEPGCLQYELHTEDNDPLQLTFVETWESDAALAGHDASAHVAAIREDIPRLTAHPITIHRLRKIA
jgi:quinol monooxygenase YgiN